MKSLLFLASVLAAAPNAMALQPLGDFLSAGRKNAPTNRAARFNRAQRFAEKDENLYRLFPSANVMFSYLYNPNEVTANIDFGTMGMPDLRQTVIIPHHQRDVTAALRVPLFNLEAIYRYRAAKSGTETAELEARAAQQQVDVQVAQAYHRFAAGEAMVKAAVERVNVLEQIVATMEGRLEVGAASKLDVDRSRAELLRARNSKVETESVRAAAGRTLESLTALQIADSDLIPLPQMITAEAPLSTWLTEVGSLPSVRAAESSLRSARENAKAAKSRYLPQIAAVANDRYSNASGIQGRTNIWQAGITATIEFDLMRPAAVRAQEAQAGAAQSRLDQARADAHNSIISAYEQIEVQRTRYYAADSLATVTREAAARAMDRFMTAAGTHAEVLQSQQEAFAAEIACALAASEYDYSRLVLRIVAGKDLLEK